VWRWRSPLEGADPVEVAERTTLGGGVFPFHTYLEGAKSRRRTIVWPIYHKRWNKYDAYEFSRTYVIPFYSDKQWDYNDGTMRRSRYFFPFTRQVISRDGREQVNALHLWFHTAVEPVDRLYAPIWEFWRRDENPENGELSIRWFQNAHRYERHADGTERRRTNLLVYQRETMREGDGDLETASTRLFWGLAGLHRDPEHGRRVELLWMKF